MQASPCAGSPGAAFEHQLGVAAVGPPRAGLDREDACGGPGVAAPGLLRRILLTTDGSVVRILESYAGESIVAARLQQITSPGGEPSDALELDAGDERMMRRVVLRTSTSDRPLIYAETLVALDRVPAPVRIGLSSTSEPIGRLLIAARLETFRDILSAGTERAGEVGAHFGIGPDDYVFTRSYLVIHRARPMMLITEKFPTTWFPEASR